jgi:curved DNA-binding protein CbpA
MLCLHLLTTQAYRRLVLVIHPDKAKGDKAEAGAWFVR